MEMQTPMTGIPMKFKEMPTLIDTYDELSGTKAALDGLILLLGNQKSIAAEPLKQCLVSVLLRLELCTKMMECAAGVE